MTKIPKTPREDPRLPKLTDAQKEFAREHYDKMTINELTKKVFDNRELDGRTFEGRALKYFLEDEDKYCGTTKVTPKGELILTQDQKDFIRENGGEGRMTTLELKKALFPEDLANTMLTRPGRAVYKYCAAIHNEVVNQWDEPVDSIKYNPPSTMPATRNIVNSHVSNSQDPAKTAYPSDNLRPFEEKCLKSMQNYLKTPRFRYQAAMYDKKLDRHLFESSFVRATHDKPDLSASDVDMYILGAAEMVNIIREERKILRLEDQLNQIFLSADEDGQKQHLSQAFVELLNQTRTKWDASKKRYQDIISGLESTRAKRNEHKIAQNQSVLNLMEAWQKDEETRNDIIAFGDKEKAEDAAEMKRLSEMEHVVALIAGFTHHEGAM